MSSNSPARPRRRLILAVTSAAVLLAATAIGMRRTGLTIAPGSVVLAVQAGEIGALTYQSDETVLKARRTAPSAAFDILAGPSNSLTRCSASPDLAGLLPQLTSITARRQLTPGQVDAEFPIKLGSFQLEDSIATEPMPRMTVRARADRSSLAFTYDNVAIETDTPPNVFAKLAAGCTALASK